MNAEKLTLEHASLLEPLFKKMKVPFSEYSFASLFLFRNIHNYQVLDSDPLWIKGQTRAGENFIFPTSPLNQIEKEKLQEMAKEADFFFPIPEEWLKGLSLEQFKFYYKESESDFIYHIDKIRHYPGRHLSKKRNLVAQFHQLYDAESFVLNQEKREDALKVLETWHFETKDLHDSDDYESAKEALNLQEKLGLIGRIYYVDQKPIGFILGEYLTSEMVVLHFIKADRLYKGVYQFLYQDFAQSLNESVKWLNFEQDLGLPALHQAKHSYHPDYLQNKFRVERA